MYRPTTSRTFAMNYGSVDSFHVSTRCGLRPKARQIRETDDCDRPVSAGHRPGGPVAVLPAALLRQRPGDHHLDLLVGDLPRRPGPRRVRQALQPALHEPHPPLADRLPRHPGPGGDRRQRRDPAVLRAGQHDPRPQGQRLRRRPLADQRLQSLALSIGQQQRDKLRARHPPSLQPAKLSMTQDTRKQVTRLRRSRTRRFTGSERRVTADGCLSRSREDCWREMRPLPDRDHAARDPIVAPPSLLDVPHLNGWAAQWDQLVDSSPLPSPFLRSWWLTGAGGPGRHFLLVVDGAHLLGGLALEQRHPMLSVRMMGDGSLCPDHLDLLAAPGHEPAVVSLLRDWLCRPGGRLLDLKGIRAGSRLIEALPGRVRREPMVVAPFTPLPDSPEAYRATLPSQFRKNLRVSAKRLAAEGMTHQAIRGRAVLPTPRHPARAPPVPVGTPLRLPSRLRSLRGRIRWWLRGR